MAIMTKHIFSYEEALTLLPRVQELTADAVARVEALLGDDGSEDGDEPSAETAAAYQHIVAGWAESVMELGIEVKGLWLIDFDSGSGYYCWRHPEPALQFFHGYEEGFSGRVQLN
jgi:hypothetical protein